MILQTRCSCSRYIYFPSSVCSVALATISNQPFLHQDEKAIQPQQSSLSFSIVLKVLLAICMLASIISIACLTALASGKPQTSFTTGAENLYTATQPASVFAAQATALTSSPTSNVTGKAFDRIMIIWNENTDFTMAAGDPSLGLLAKQGITLNNYFGVTHPSEPNYCASLGGDYFGMNNDAFNQVPGNVSTVVDLLDDKCISWGVYQEDLPFSGFEGVAWVNQKSNANDYVRKHNPPVLYNSVATRTDRLSQIKNLTQFQNDYQSGKLPQWMFITPNMTSDGHDTSVTVAGRWTLNFLAPLLQDKNFMARTLILVTFDENHTKSIGNRVFSILLGGAVPQSLQGTTDSNYYNHYSGLATVEANWGLHTLGRFDIGANVFKLVADQTQDQVRAWPEITGQNPTVFSNQSYAGLFNDRNNKVGFPAPKIDAVVNGRTVLPAIQQTWAGFNKTYYTTDVKIPDGLNPPAGH